MDSDIFMELDSIQEELESGIGLIAVIAEGLEGFSQSCCLSGKGRRRYVSALYLTYDTLLAISGRLRKLTKEGCVHRAAGRLAEKGAEVYNTEYFG